uniref:Uncharacterized protein n=1 Tax=Terrapene triunguis TaxID=2587831 RepID=A0A674HZA3_9SAUR
MDSPAPLPRAGSFADVSSLTPRLPARGARTAIPSAPGPTPRHCPLTARSRAKPRGDPRSPGGQCPAPTARPRSPPGPEPRRPAPPPQYLPQHRPPPDIATAASAPSPVGRSRRFPPVKPAHKHPPPNRKRNPLSMETAARPHSPLPVPDAFWVPRESGPDAAVGSADGSAPKWAARRGDRVLGSGRSRPELGRRAPLRCSRRLRSRAGMERSHLGEWHGRRWPGKRGLPWGLRLPCNAAAPLSPAGREQRPVRGHPGRIRDPPAQPGASCGALRSLPPGLALGPSLAQEPGMGVWCVGRALSPGALFGPRAEGKLDCAAETAPSEAIQSGCCCSDESICVRSPSWRSLVKRGRGEDEANVALVWISGRLHIRVRHPIAAGTELLYWPTEAQAGPAQVEGRMLQSVSEGIAVPDEKKPK